MPVFNNPKSARRIIWTFIAIFVAAAFWATSCEGAELELAGGVTVVRAPAPVIAATVIFPRQIGNMDLYAGVTLIGDYTLDGERFGNQAVLRAGVTARVKRFGISLGYARIQHDDGINSGVNNFNLGLQWDLTKPSVVVASVKSWKDGWLTKIDHVSNAGSSKPNKGRDMVLVAKRFR